VQRGVVVKDNLFVALAAAGAGVLIVQYLKNSAGRAQSRCKQALLIAVLPGAAEKICRKSAWARCLYNTSHDIEYVFFINTDIFQGNGIPVTTRMLCF